MQQLRSILLIILFTDLSQSSLWAQSDSLIILFSNIKNYTISFYSNDWEALLKQSYEAGDKEYIPAQFSDGNITLDSVGVRYKGNSSYTSSLFKNKKPFKIKFTEFKSKQYYYGLSKLNFSNNHQDPSNIREMLAYELYRKYIPAPHASPVTLTITQNNGDTILDLGLYTQVEQVDKKFLEKNFSDKEQNLFKAGDKGSALLFVGNNPSDYQADLSLKTREKNNDWSGMLTFLQVINTIDNCANFVEYVDVENILWYFAISHSIANYDSYIGSSRNYYLYQLNDNGTMQIIPWDLNLAYGAYSNNWNVYKKSVLQHIAERPLFNQILACPELRLKYVQKIDTLLNNDLLPQNFAVKVDSLADLVRPLTEIDENSLFSVADFEKNLATKVQTASGSIPGLKEFNSQRVAAISAELEIYNHEAYVGIVKHTISNNSSKKKLPWGSYEHNSKVFNILGQNVDR